MTDAQLTLSGVETTGEAKARHAVSLGELARTFFVIGLTGFGGGMAIVALIQQICVERRRWLSEQEFAHGVALSQFLGAFAVNATTFVGYRVRGVAGAVVAVVAFLTPGVAAIVVLAALYYRYQHMAALQHMLRGIGPVVVAVLVTAATRMGRGSMSRLEPILIAIAAFLGFSLLSIPVALIVTALLVYGVARHLMHRRKETN